MDLCDHWVLVKRWSYFGLGSRRFSWFNSALSKKTSGNDLFLLARFLLRRYFISLVSLALRISVLRFWLNVNSCDTELICK